MKKNYITHLFKTVALFLITFTAYSQSPCAGVPAGSSVLGPTNTICPGVVTLSLSNTYSNSGITYQWQMSTASGLGPFSAIPGATLGSCQVLATNSVTYYNAIITCTNGNNSTTAAVAQISVAPGTTTNSVPYSEGFQGISSANQLPNCSWSMGTSCLTYTSGSGNGASFYYNPAGTNSFYSNGIKLNAGVVYSVSAWYSTGFGGSSPWTNFSLLVGPNQSALNQTTVASVSGIISVNIPTALSNTFTIPTSGMYYVSVQATSNGTSGSLFLNWDDLSIIAPCSPAYNTPSVSIVASSTVVCSGQAAGQLTLTASGASTYSWNTGASTQTITDSPNSSGIYIVTGTSSLSGCSKTASVFIGVNQSPNLLLFASTPVICKGATANIVANGASSYTWSNGQQTSMISVSPSVSTVYTVTGAAVNGCTVTSSQIIQVNPLPVITVSSSVISNTICNGNLDTLGASGALSYQWSSNTGMLVGSQIIVSPNVTTTYVVTGTDNNNCSSQTNYVLYVSGCTGLNHLSTAAAEIAVIPNPFHEEFLLNTGTNETKTITITDVSGRAILSISSREDRIVVNTKYFCNGIYYITVTSAERTKILKIIKA